MSLEQEIQKLNENIVTLTKLLETYPSPVDNLVDTTQVDNAVTRAKAEKEAAKPAPDTEADTGPVHTIDDLDKLAKLAQQAIKADKAGNAPKIREKLAEFNAKKVTATPPAHIDEMHAFLESLV